MVNFNIIENDYSLQDKYKEFKDYYLHPEQITLAEIMTRLNLSHSQARKLRQQVSRETGLKRSTSSRKLIPVTMKCTVHPKKYFCRSFPKTYSDAYRFRHNPVSVWA